MTGVLNVGGTDYRVSAWSNKSKKGDSYLSLKISVKDDAPF